MTQKKKPNKKKNRKALGHTNIAAHKFQNKQLITPLNQIRGITPSSWMNDRLPEMLWAALIAVQLERKDAFKVYWAFMNKAFAFDYGEEASDCTLTGLSLQRRDFFGSLVETLCAKEAVRIALRPLLHFPDLPGLDVWKDYIKDSPQEDDWQTLQIAIVHGLDHQSEMATDCRWVRLMFRVVTGQMHYSRERYEELAGYPFKGDMREIRPSIRAAEITFSLGETMSGEPTVTAWPEKFWASCLQDTPCEGQFEQEALERPDRLALLERYTDLYDQLLEHQIRTLSTSSVDARHDIVFGIAFFCLSIWMELAQDVRGESILGRMGLRTLVEQFMTLAYLAKKDTPELWTSYRVYGAGQAKLSLLKLEESDEEALYVDQQTLEDLANEDYWQEFLDVNLAHWANSNLRNLATQGDVKDVYDRYYSWTSTYLHGHWGAIRDAVFQTCRNPLHRLHRIPRHSPRPLEDVLPDASALVDQVLDIVDSLYPGFKTRLRPVAPVSDESPDDESSSDDDAADTPNDEAGPES